MISIVYCTKEPKPEHTEHLRKVSGNPKVEVIEYVNKGEGLTKFYQKALDEAKNDIIVFCHDDILIETNQIAKKLTKLFDNNPEYGIIGVAGTKQMSESGRWWDNPKMMYGKVKHTHKGKSWLSSYSNDLGNDVTEAVVVDGVFFSVHRGRLKKGFNQDVKGFHFYDVDFCFRNYIESVKVGVHTNIRVNHMSIGETNEEWEENRKVFAERYKEYLPVKIKIDFNKEKLKVLIGCVNFQGYTGSELYVYELAKQLIKQNCEVSVCSNIGSPLVTLAHRLGIKMYDIQQPPGFKLGDGKWTLNTQNGPVVSQENTLYKVGEVGFDIIHANHKPITERLLQLYPNIPTVCSIHSEVIPLEEPVISDLIKGYIAIRPEIKDYIINSFNVPEKSVEVIYNPIDTEKFNITKNSPNRDKKRVLFVGTIDYLRKEMIKDLINTTKENNEELYIVGKKNDTYLDEMLVGNDHVSYFPPSNRTQDYIHNCDETAGILLGRTTIEGWLCGKPGWIYDVNSAGTIISKILHEVPEDVNKFSGEKVATEIKELYVNVINDGNINNTL
tara:strand:- start:62814 stop:64481 length:1668 start_codon:yes stop_codon:yes gene_type:complete